MSAFKTPIAVDVDGLRKLLPVNAVIEKVLFDGKEVQVLWHSGRLTSPWTYPVLFTREQLEKRQLPEKVSYLPEPVLPPPAAPPAAPPAVPAKAKPAKAPRAPKVGVVK